MQSLALDIRVLSDKNEEIEIRESIDDELDSVRTSDINDLADADMIYNESDGGYHETDEIAEEEALEDEEREPSDEDLNNAEFDPDGGSGDIDDLFIDGEDEMDFE